MNKSLRKILAFSLKNKYFIYFATVIMVIYGVITFINMPIEAFPDVTNTEISTSTFFSSRRLERFKTAPSSRNGREEVRKK